MYKYLLLALSLLLITDTVSAEDSNPIIENLDGSHFQRADIYNGKVWGEGKCTVSGSRDWQGRCQMELFTRGPLNRYDIYLSDSKTLYTIVQIDASDKDHYLTRSDGKDVKTTINPVSDREVIFTMGDMKVHVMLGELKERADPGFSHESAFTTDQAFMIMARGQGSCELSGGKSYTGNCSMELLTRGMLEERYNIQLDDADSTHFSIVKLTDGSKRYVTRIDGQDVATTIEDIEIKKNVSTESIITFGDDLKLHIDLKKVQIRSGS